MSVLDNVRRNIRDLLPDREQTAFAKKIGMSASLLSNYLTGEKEPGVAQLEKIAAGLGTTVPALMGDVTPAPAPPRRPKPEEMAVAILMALDLPGEKLEVIENVLQDDNFFNTCRTVLIGRRNASPVKKSKPSAG